MRTLSKRDEAGAIAILFAAGVVFLFVLAAIVVDLGLARETRRDAQNAADSAALAAANRLYLTSTTPDLVAATQAAKDYAAANFGVTASAWNTGNCSDPAHLAVLAVGTQCISFNSAANPTTVRVKIPSTEIRTGLGKLADVDSISVQALAEAGVAAATDYRCALCFLGPVESGNGDVTVTGGGIQVAGDLDIGSQSHWSASSPIGVSGTFSGNQAHVSPSLATPKPPAFTDPLASRPLPSLGGTNRTATTSCNTTIQPGIYHNLTLGNKDVCTLAPGNYVITGRWLLGNNSILQSSGGVTLFFTCGSAGAPAYCASGATTGGGWLDGKNGTVGISNGGTGTWNDHAIVYDRNNPQSISLQGNGGTSITGGVYIPRGLLDLNGTSCFGFSKGPVIAMGINKLNGNKSCINVLNAVDVTATSRPGAIALSK